MFDFIDDFADHAERRDECVACGQPIRSGEALTRTTTGPVCDEHNDETVGLHFVETTRPLGHGSTICDATLVVGDTRTWLGQVAQHHDGTWLAFPDKHTELLATSRDDALLVLVAWSRREALDGWESAVDELVAKFEVDMGCPPDCDGTVPLPWGAGSAPCPTHPITV